MKGLSLTQPWATLVALGAKTIETRSWSTTYRGLVAVHAAKKFPNDAVEIMATRPFFGVLTAAGYCVESRENPRRPRQLLMAGEGEPLPLGAVVATAFLAECLPITGRSVKGKRTLSPDFSPGSDLVIDWQPGPTGDHVGDAESCADHEAAFGDYTHGRFGLLLTDVRRLAEPVPCRGALGLWDLPLDDPAILGMVRGDVDRRIEAIVPSITNAAERLSRPGATPVERADAYEVVRRIQSLKETTEKLARGDVL